MGFYVENDNPVESVVLRDLVANQKCASPIVAGRGTRHRGHARPQVEGGVDGLQFNKAVHKARNPLIDKGFQNRGGLTMNPYWPSAEQSGWADLRRFAA
jgi:hypothetical protein